jgi:hypothetical protein
MLEPCLLVAREAPREGDSVPSLSSRLETAFSAERLPEEASMRILRTLMASFPKLKKEKKYYNGQPRNFGADKLRTSSMA